MKNLVFLTVAEVAHLLKLNIITVYEYIKSQQLKAVKLGRNYRIDEEALSDFIRKHTV